METKFTKGPYNMERVHNGWVFSGLDGAYDICVIRDCNGDRNGQNTANANLIAAAPDLYAALDMLQANLAEYIAINNLGAMLNQDMVNAISALKKARGES